MRRRRSDGGAPLGLARVLAAGLAFTATAAHAEVTAGQWLRQRGSAEWVVAAASFRAAVGTDPRVPGFDTFSGGGELMLGLDFASGLGIVVSGRILAGGQAGAPYLEGLVGASLQLRLAENFRLRAGPAAGQAKLDRDTTILVGGFLAATIDLFALGSGRLSATLAMRLDVDAMIGGQRFPDKSMALALGAGLRY